MASMVTIRGSRNEDFLKHVYLYTYKESSTRAPRECATTVPLIGSLTNVCYSLLSHPLFNLAQLNRKLAAWNFVSLHGRHHERRGPR